MVSRWCIRHCERYMKPDICEIGYQLCYLVWEAIRFRQYHTLSRLVHVVIGWDMMAERDY